MAIPLLLRLRRRLHAQTALLQDEVVEALYAVEPAAVLHGGTALWRCYGGHRFSEDLDFYLKAAEPFRKRLQDGLSARGLQVPKWRVTPNAIYARIANSEVEVRLEVALRRVSGAVVRPYERADGTTLTVLTLTPAALLCEKAAAYRSRRLIRDLYDVAHLAPSAAGDAAAREAIRQLLASPPLPADEKELRTIALGGAVPSYLQLLESLRRFA